jgi:hypothetical protein
VQVVAYVLDTFAGATRVPVPVGLSSLVDALRRRKLAIAGERNLASQRFGTHLLNLTIAVGFIPARKVAFGVRRRPSASNFPLCR